MSLESNIPPPPDFPPPPPPPPMAPEGGPPPLPPYSPFIAKRTLPTVDPLKSKLNKIQQQVLKEYSYDMTKDKATRMRVPSDFKDILPLDDMKNVWALGGIQLKLSKPELDHIKELTHKLKTDREEFDKKCNSAAKNILYKDPDSRKTAESEVEEAQQLASIINKDAEEIRKEISQLRVKANTQKGSTEGSKQVEEGRAHPAEGMQWYAQLKPHYEDYKKQKQDEANNYEIAIAQAHGLISLIQLTRPGQFDVQQLSQLSEEQLQTKKDEILDLVKSEYPHLYEHIEKREIGKLRNESTQGEKLETGVEEVDQTTSKDLEEAVTKAILQGIAREQKEVPSRVANKYEKLQKEKKATSAEWLENAVKSLKPNDTSDRALDIREAASMLGGTGNIAINLKDYEKKMLTEQERM